MILISTFCSNQDGQIVLVVVAVGLSLEESRAADMKCVEKNKNEFDKILIQNVRDVQLSHNVPGN